MSTATLEKEENLIYKKKYQDNLEEEVKNLERRKENLENQVQDLRVRLESERKAIEVQTKLKFQNKEDSIKQLSNKVSDRESKIDRQEKSLKSREEAIERHEAILGDVNLERQKLLIEKGEFLNYKRRIEKELESKKVLITEANAKWDELGIEEDRLMGVAKSISVKEKELDAERGILKQERDDFEKYKMNVLDTDKYNKEKENVKSGQTVSTSIGSSGKGKEEPGVISGSDKEGDSIIKEGKGKSIKLKGKSVK